MVTRTAEQDTAGGRYRYLRELGLPILFGAVVLLGSATLLLFANISALNANLRSMEHSQKVLTQIAELETGILGDELTVRGYALTGDARFLAFQKFERAKSDKAKAELLRLSSDEPEHLAEYQRVMRDVAWHEDTFSKLSGYGPDKSQVVAHAIVDPQVRANMKRTRLGLAALRNQEFKDLGDRQRQMTDQISRAFFLAVGIILLAFALGGVGIWAARLQGPREVKF